MEIGQEITLKVILQHEFGLLFAEKFERMKLRVVESHPMIAKSELTEFNSQIKIRAYIKGDTNIILFHPETKKIYDVFKISVFNTVLLPERIVLNIGGQVDFLGKDIARKQMLTHDAEWSSDDPNIVKIDPIDGIATGLNEGKTTVHLKSKDKTKLKLSTVIFVEKVRSVQIDKSRLPAFFTDIKTSPYYNNEYRIPVKFFVDVSSNNDLSSDLTDQLNKIEQNLNFKCSASNPEFVFAEADTKDNTTECVVKIRDIPFNAPVPQNLELEISTEATGEKKEQRIVFNTVVRLPFTSAFKIKNNVHAMTFTKNNRTNYIYVDNLNDVDIKVDDEFVVRTEENKEDGNVKIYVPYNITRDFKDVKIILRNKITDQKEEIYLSYVQEPEEEQTILFGLINRDTFIDFLTLVLLVAIIIILYIYITSTKEVR